MSHRPLAPSQRVLSALRADWGSVLTLEAGTWMSEKRLPLEGGAPRSESKIYMAAGDSHTATTLSQRQLRRMRSKRSMITISWFKIATFDLIRHGP